MHVDTTATTYGGADCNGDVLAELIIEASTLFDIDRGRAKRCLDRAAEVVCSGQPQGLPRLRSRPTRGGLCGWQVNKVKVYIESNIGGKISIANLAALARHSQGHFSRAFKASCGESPRAYIQRQRILHAQVLIQNSDASLAHIAIDCGLCDQAHLSRVFRRIVGVTPRAWGRGIPMEIPSGPLARHKAALTAP